MPPSNSVGEPRLPRRTRGEHPSHEREPALATCCSSGAACRRGPREMDRGCSGRSRLRVRRQLRHDDGRESGDHRRAGHRRGGDEADSPFDVQPPTTGGGKAEHVPVHVQTVEMQLLQPARRLFCDASLRFISTRAIPGRRRERASVELAVFRMLMLVSRRRASRASRWALASGTTSFRRVGCAGACASARLPRPEPHRRSRLGSGNGGEGAAGVGHGQGLSDRREQPSVGCRDAGEGGC